VGGVLYIVGTPIGNLEDLSVRAARTLRTVAMVACEDTRQSAKLMEAAEAHRPLVSLHEHNERERIDEILQRLGQGEDIALISDAGTPLVSDPGFRVVAAAVEAGFKVSPIPGPSAVLSALSVAALPTDAFAFLGFLPHKAVARQKVLEQWAGVEATLVFFESPHRILETLEQLAELFPKRRLALGRELTKIHEEVLRGTAGELWDELARRPAVKGEFTVVMDRAGEPEIAAEPDTLRSEVDRLQGLGVSRMDAIKQAAKAAGIGKREAYEMLERKK
jgi:16S rRNA (cytidine1402-2'-O)-methyltransferase